MKDYTAEDWLPSHSGLGESPLYRASDDTLFFVDIKNQLVHSVPIAQGWAKKKTLELPEPVTRVHVVAGRQDVLAVQTKLGFALLDLQKGTLDRINEVCHADDERELDGKVRMNDGAVDAKGRWWAGTMALDEESKLGRLWCLREGRVEDMSSSSGGQGEEERAAVPNGPVFSPDDRIMYVCDTPQGKIYRYDYDVESGAATNRRLFVQLEGGGMPDGAAVDVEGHVWVAANSQGKLVRYSPEGEVSGTCAVPGAKMTSCPAFGVDDMKTLFITSIAAEGSTGNVYRVRVDVAGVEQHPYRI
ncbi:Uu.00g065530.m01.CDS01 [Anthostomella pinea]|uniref:Uu.00g065530.m01.CDS01 n=1 Tax=Anthostomella pinea TaxID=933095 RepID=A0AAI8VTS8_9PEZI|nr:Uu.00g065530.m01.CDS01 [Anthostomella pinea]